MLGGVCTALAERSHLPALLFRFGFFALSASTNWFGPLLYLSMWILMPQPDRAIVPLWLRRAGIGAAILGVIFLMSTARGTVTLRDKPLGRADVVLIDDHAVLRTAQTDAHGEFRVWHWPSVGRVSLAICAPGVFPYVADPSAATTVHTNIDLMDWDRRFPPPIALARITNLPASCRAPVT